MTPPSTPPVKTPDRHYDFGRLNMWFAVSSLGLLAVTLWMVFADYAQPWKRLQAEFRSLERQKLQAEAKAEAEKIQATQVAQLEKDIAQAEAEVAKSGKEIEALKEREKDFEAKRFATDARWRATKSQLDASRFEYDTALQHGGDSKKERERVEELRGELREAKKAVEEYTAQRDAIRQQIAEKRAAVTKAEEQLAALRSGLEGVQKRIDGLNKGLDYFVLNAPLMDFIQPTLHVQQAILPGIYQNVYFTDIERVDRCMTCHVAANRPGFDGEEWKQPFRTHPRLDTFVGDSSPHPYTRFGCTSCHGGLDRATDFARAGHSLPFKPVGAGKAELAKWEEDREHWIERWNWEQQHYLDQPILPAKISEAGCATCHAADVWTPGSEVQEAGRELIVHMGCNGCHVADYPAFTGLRKAGPALTRIAGKTRPEWAYKWIEAPRDFHPTTWMPHFFYQENIKPKDRPRQQAEIAAIVTYLWDKSERPEYPPAPPGNPASGKQLFETVGCAGCHILDAKAKRDDFFPVINRLHGPNLVRTGSKVSSGWLYAWVKDPKQYFPDTNMPDLRLTDQEAADVTAYLLASRDGKYENLKLPAIDGRARDELALSYLQNTFTIERGQAKLAAMSQHERTVYLGEQTIAKYGCFGCHDIAGFEGLKPIGTELTEEGSKPLHQLDFGHVHEVPDTRHDWVRTKLLRPRIWDRGKEDVKDYNELLKMPGFGMSQREADAVLANVMGFTKESVVATSRAGTAPRTAALAEGRKLITRYNCQGCHLIEGNGHAIKTMIQDIAMLPPNLAAEGARVQSDWLFSYLHDPSRVRMRPWLTVRMPTFGFSDDQANAVISYFAAREQRPQFTSEPGRPDARDLAVGGVVFDLFQCAKCHPAGAEAAKAAGVSGAGLGDLAPSLLLAHDRLRYDWVPSWIKDPQKWIPGTRMPSNFPETAPGQYMSPVAQAIDSPAYAAQKQQMLRQFSSEAELKAYLGDVDKVTAALRAHIWRLSGGLGAAETTVAPSAPASPVAARPAAGTAGSRAAGGGR